MLGYEYNLRFLRALIFFIIMKTIDILGVKINVLTADEAISQAEFFLTSNKTGKYIVTANPEIVLTAKKYPDYRQILNDSVLTVADGVGLLWAAEFLNQPGNIINAFFISLYKFLFKRQELKDLKENIAGVDLLVKICKLAARKNYSVYLLGGLPETARLTAEKLKKHLPNLKIVGVSTGPLVDLKFIDDKMVFNDAQLLITEINKINGLHPDILFVAFGAPKQEIFLHEYLKNIPSVKLAMGVGGSFDFLSGKVKRAPQVFRDLNLEWLWRLIHEPWRLKRIFNATVSFVYFIVKYRVLGR